MLTTQDESIKDFIHYHLMPLFFVSDNFLDSSDKKFNKFYDIELHRYINLHLFWDHHQNEDENEEDIEYLFGYRIPHIHLELTRLKFSNYAIEQEISFIEDLTKYLVHKNRSNLRLRNINIENFILKSHNLDSDLIDLFNLSNRSQEEDETLTSLYIDYINSNFQKSKYLKKYISQISSFEKKLRFLKFKAEKLGYRLSVTEEIKITKIEVPPSEYNTDIDSEVKLSKREIFLILNELDIIDRIVEKLPSEDNDAPINKILQAITGHNMQYILNSFKNSDRDQNHHNNPYKECRRGIDPVNKVRSMLMKYGVKNIKPLRNSPLSKN